MPIELNRLTAKFVEHAKVRKGNTRKGAKKGDPITKTRYADGGGLYLEVLDTGAKSWVFTYSRDRARRKLHDSLLAGGASAEEIKIALDRFGGKTGNIGLGSAHAGHTTLAEAREKAAHYRKQIRDGLDPKAQKEKERRERWKADARNTTFEAMALEYIEARTNDAERPWGRGTRKAAERYLLVYLKPLHEWPVADITPGQIFSIINPLRQSGIKDTAHLIRTHAVSVFKWAIGRGVFPADKVIPASIEAMQHLLNTKSTTPRNTPHAALHFNKMPALFDKIEQNFKTRSYYTVGEAARAVRRDQSTIALAAQEGRLIASKRTPIIFPTRGGPRQSWEIEPANLFKLWDEVEKVIPSGLSPVTVYVLKFGILCGSRPTEARCMIWDEYHKDDQEWIIPWQRMKEGYQIRIDHHVQLSDPAIEIIEILREQQRRDGIKTHFVFGNYRTARSTSSCMGHPPASRTVRNLLANLLGHDADATELLDGSCRSQRLKHADATLHGMRVAFGSWAKEQGCYHELDIERALSHAKGYGPDMVARIYLRDARREAAMRKLFADWGRYCMTGELPADALPSAEIIPIRKIG
jgi:integrase